MKEARHSAHSRLHPRHLSWTILDPRESGSCPACTRRRCKTQGGGFGVNLPRGEYEELSVPQGLRLALQTCARAQFLLCRPSRGDHRPWWRHPAADQSREWCNYRSQPGDQRTGIQHSALCWKSRCGSESQRPCPAETSRARVGSTGCLWGWRWRQLEWKLAVWQRRFRWWH